MNKKLQFSQTNHNLFYQTSERCFPP